MRRQSNAKVDSVLVDTVPSRRIAGVTTVRTRTVPLPPLRPPPRAAFARSWATLRPMKRCALRGSAAKYVTIVAAAALLLCALGAHAQNPLLDEVGVRIEGSTAKVRIRFTAPVSYLWHFPLEHGELVLIFFRVITVDGDEISLRDEVRRVHATGELPGFTVTYVHPPSHDVVRDPLSVLIQFDRPVSYKVSEGKDKRSLYLIIPLTPAATSDQ